MRSILSFALFCTLMLAGCSGARQAADEPPPSLVGDWSGQLNAMGTSLRIIFHVQEAADGTLTATLDSPDQGASGLQVNEVSLDGDQVRMVARGISGVYTGTLRPGAQAIDGTWAQGGQTFALNLERAGE